MAAAPELLDLIARIYDAVHEPKLWEPVLADATELIGAERALLAAYFGADRAGVAAHRRLNPESLRLWLEEYMEHDVWGDLVRRQPPGQAGIAHELLPPEELQETVIYNDVLRRDGIEDALGVNLWVSEGSTAVIGFYQGGDRGLFHPSQAARLQALAPHLSRSLQLSFRMRKLEERHAALSAALDRVPFGILTLDRAGFVVDANRAAREIAGRGDGLRIERGRLRAGRSDDQAALETGIGRACTAGCGAELLVARPSLLRPWHVLVSPASPAVQSPVIDLFDRRPAALVFVSDPEAEARSPVEALVAFFGLTPAEARVASALAAGRSIDEYAEEAGLTRETARQYLKRALQKTGARRQGELVGQVLRSVASLASDSEG